MNNQEIPRVYIACLASYNNGILHGKWIDITDFDSVQDEINEILKHSPVADAEEYAIHDYEGFGGYRLSEYEGLKETCEIANLIKQYGEIFGDVLSYYSDIEDAKKALEENYYGKHESELDFAYDFFNEIYGHEVTESINFYLTCRKTSSFMERM